MNDDYSALPWPPTRLSDEAAVEILDFLHRFIDAFETAYGDQIRRRYQDLESSRNTDPRTDYSADNDDPPY